MFLGSFDVFFKNVFLYKCNKHVFMFFYLQTNVLTSMLQGQYALHVIGKPRPTSC